MTGAVHVWSGPTIAPADAARIAAGALAHPPARHGDLLAAGLQAGDTAVLIDGAWFQDPPVRHKEILHLLAAGVRVVGAASMGALRAAELHPYGMTGVGEVFAAYRDGLITDDDEVAVACRPDGGARLSEAMVDVRHSLRRAADGGAITQAEAESLAGVLKAMHYPRRTWAALWAGAPPDLQAAAGRLRRWSGAAGGFASLKEADARRALELAARGALPPARPPVWAGRDWQSVPLRDWLARFAPTGAGGPPLEAMLRHQQIHDPGFPARWRRHVLAWLPGGRPGGERGAVSAAAAAGIGAGGLTAEQSGCWLTDDEAGLPDAEKLARALVRLASVDLTARIWPAALADAGGLLSPLRGSAGAVAAADRVNEDVAGRGPGRTIWHLREDLVAAYLRELWRAGPGERDLTAAARDRGFPSAQTAVDDARRFYLLARAGGP